jgi:uncharacterized protein
MIVPVRELPEERRVELTSEFIEEALAGLPMREALERSKGDAGAGHAVADLSIYAAEDENVFVRGPLQGWIEVACSRCLGPARVTLDESLAVTYLPKGRLPALEVAGDGDASGHGAGPGAGPSGAGGRARTKVERRGGAPAGAGDAADASDAELGMELAEDDLDLYSYEDEEVDLTPLFRDQVILAVPFAPLCKEDCKGLCPQCGADRNHETCDCKPPVDPRWAALQTLKS